MRCRPAYRSIPRRRHWPTQSIPRTATRDLRRCSRRYTAGKTDRPPHPARRKRKYRLYSSRGWRPVFLIHIRNVWKKYPTSYSRLPWAPLRMRLLGWRWILRRSISGGSARAPWACWSRPPKKQKLPPALASTSCWPKVAKPGRLSASRQALCYCSQSGASQTCPSIYGAESPSTRRWPVWWGARPGSRSTGNWRS